MQNTVLFNTTSRPYFSYCHSPLPIGDIAGQVLQVSYPGSGGRSASCIVRFVMLIPWVRCVQASPCNFGGRKCVRSKSSVQTDCSTELKWTIVAANTKSSAYRRTLRSSNSLRFGGPTREIGQTNDWIGFFHVRCTDGLEISCRPLKIQSNLVNSKFDEGVQIWNKCPLVEAFEWTFDIQRLCTSALREINIYWTI